MYIRKLNYSVANLGRLLSHCLHVFNSWLLSPSMPRKGATNSGQNTNSPCTFVPWYTSALTDHAGILNNWGGGLQIKSGKIEKHSYSVKSVGATYLKSYNIINIGIQKMQSTKGVSLTTWNLSPSTVKWEPASGREERLREGSGSAVIAEEARGVGAKYDDS